MRATKNKGKSNESKNPPDLIVFSPTPFSLPIVIDVSARDVTREKSDDSKILPPNSSKYKPYDYIALMKKKDFELPKRVFLSVEYFEGAYCIKDHAGNMFTFCNTLPDLENVYKLVLSDGSGFEFQDPKGAVVATHAKRKGPEVQRFVDDCMRFLVSLKEEDKKKLWSNEDRSRYEVKRP